MQLIEAGVESISGSQTRGVDSGLTTTCSPHRSPTKSMEESWLLSQTDKEVIETWGGSWREKIRIGDMNEAAII